ncbi:MAG: alpha/beta hydrolase [Chloroflexi bacterium]|nr:alpha/beta hydrolase [Chloroflexota bacterium]
MKTVGKFLLISLVIYLSITVVLITTNRPTELVADGMNFEALTRIDYESMPDLHPYITRDGSELAYRFYKSNVETENVLILLHGSGWHGMQFHPLAEAISASGAAHIFVPDLRGHGFNPKQRGDVAYIGQLENDVADLIGVIKVQFPNAKIIVGGHSSGGGLAIRFAGGEHGNLADGYLLLAPFLEYNAPTTQPNSGGWARPLTRRIIGLTMLNNIGIRWFNHLTVIQFNMPQSVLDGALGHTATTAYSYRLNSSFAPRSNVGRDLAAMNQPFLLVAGLEDESFIAEQYEPTISQHTESGEYMLLPDTGHIDLLTTPQLASIVTAWLNVSRIGNPTRIGE